MSGKRFRRERKLYQLTFEAEELDGFECIMAGVSLDKFVEITALAAVLETEEGRTRKNIEAQFTTLAACLESWNLDDDDGKPIPCDYEGLRIQDFDFVMAIMLGWMGAIASVPKASSETSPSGVISAVPPPGLGSASKSRAS